MKVLQTGIPAEKLSLTYGADDGEGRQVRIQDGIRDASAAYRVLYKQGLVTPQGKEFSAAVKNSLEFKEFTAKMRWLYDAIGETMVDLFTSGISSRLGALKSSVSSMGLVLRAEYFHTAGHR